MRNVENVSLTDGRELAGVDILKDKKQNGTVPYSRRSSLRRVLVAKNHIH